MCRKSCGLCPGDTPVKTKPAETPTPTPLPTPANRGETFLTPSTCVDNVEACSVWARAGECTRNSKFMNSECPKSCGACTPTDEVAAKKELRKEIEAAKLKRRAAALGDGDEDDDDDSPMDDTPRTLSAKLKEEAKLRKPELTLDDLRAGAHAATPGKPACVDANPRCLEWSKAGECEANTVFMRSNCIKSCGLCGEQRFQPPEAAAAAAATPQQTLPAAA